MLVVPRVRQVQACDDFVLHITFANGVTKLDDLKPALSDERFSILRDRAFLKAVQVDGGECGISRISAVGIG